MKPLLLVAAALLTLAGCSHPTRMHTVHVSSTLELERGCFDVYPELSTVFPIDAVTCQRPDAVLLMHSEIKCAGVTQYRHDGWNLIQGQLYEVTASVDPAKPGPGSLTYGRTLYTIDAAGGITPSGDERTTYTFENQQLVARYPSSSGPVTEKIELTEVDEEQIALEVESEQLGGCLSGPSW
jgi:hypothetical protein